MLTLIVKVMEVQEYVGVVVVVVVVYGMYRRAGGAAGVCMGGGRVQESAAVLFARLHIQSGGRKHPLQNGKTI